MEKSKKKVESEEDFEQNITTFTLYREKAFSDIQINFRETEKFLTKSKVAFDKNFQKNVPLLVKDILSLNLDKNSFGKNLSVFGVPFGAVMIYGICTPKGCDNKSKKLKYILDDGTGEINIKFGISEKIRKCKEKVLGLREELHLQNITQHCNDSNLNKCLFNILKKTEENLYVPESHYPAGSRIYVVGIPYMIKNDTWIHAKEIFLDDVQCRNTEILYKEHLLRFYNRYSSNSRNNIL